MKQVDKTCGECIMSGKDEKLIQKFDRKTWREETTWKIQT